MKQRFSAGTPVAGDRHLLKGMNEVMDILEVNDSNLVIYLNLCQSYEGEFSAITLKKPDEHGRFALDTAIGGAVRGYLLYQEGLPVGFAAVKVQAADESFEVCEFYVVPSCRKQQLGKRFAHALFRRHQGDWEIKQISGAADATAFWRRVIADFTGGVFREDVYQDGYWGQVVRQRFVCGEESRRHASQ